MKSGDREIVTVVPGEHRWLRALYAALTRARLPVSDAILADRVLRIDMGPPGDPSLSVVVRPHGSGGPGWRRTRHFVVGYDGAGDLAPAQEKSLVVFHGLLSRFEPGMPRGLEGFASIGVRQRSPEETLRKLFPFVTVERSRVDEDLPYASQGEIVEVLVRTTARCNQSCPFCSAPQHDEPSGEMLCACFKAVADMLPGAMVSLTGGEPTLRSSFMSEVETVLGLETVSRVQVQTNALRFTSRLDPGSIAPNEKLSFFVSLHALKPEIYDRCTKTSGQLARAVKGIQRILDAGHSVIVNTVITSENLGHLNEMVRSLPQTFAGENRPALHFSVLICPEWNPRSLGYLVRYTEVVEALKRAARSARELGIDAHSPLSSTHASMPPCLVAEETRQQGRHFYRIAPHETGYEDFSRPYVKAKTCSACSETERCLGVPRPYAETFGLAELEPLGGK